MLTAMYNASLILLSLIQMIGQIYKFGMIISCVTMTLIFIKIYSHGYERSHIFEPRIAYISKCLMKNIHTLTFVSLAWPYVLYALYMKEKIE